MVAGSKLGSSKAAQAGPLRDDAHIAKSGELPPKALVRAGLAIHGTAILSSLFGWGIAFLLAALVEEFLFRGYIQYTLTSGTGFWPAAFVMSGLFGLGHFFNSHENAVGSIAVVMFGLLLCLFLRRTGSLWCAVGFHLGYDWGQMFYGVPDSGIVPYHNLLSSILSGSQWLTGGMDHRRLVTVEIRKLKRSMINQYQDANTTDNGTGCAANDISSSSSRENTGSSKTLRLRNERSSRSASVVSLENSSPCDTQRASSRK